MPANSPLYSPPFTSFHHRAPIPLQFTPTPPSVLASQRPLPPQRESVWDIIASYSRRSPTSPSLHLPNSPRRVRFPRDSHLVNEIHSYPPSGRFSSLPPSPPLDIVHEETGKDLKGDLFSENGKIDRGLTPPPTFEVSVGGNDVFQRLAQMEGGQKMKGGFNLGKGFEDAGEKKRGLQFSVKLLIAVVRLLMVVASFTLVCIVLLSPARIGRGGGLLRIGLSGNRTVVLGPLGGCLQVLNTGAKVDTSCTPSSMTPYFTPLYATVEIATATQKQLPFSSPLLGAALILVLAFLATTFILLMILSFPTRMPLPRRLDIIRTATCSIFASLVIAIPTTISTRLSYGDVKVDGVSLGSSFALLAAAESIAALAALSLVVVELGNSKAAAEDTKY